jgi:Tol biopolymer transport system component/DNA-binding winged helix-turn-helix (wHTH) protein
VIEERRQVYEFDEFRLDAAKRQLRRGAEIVPLYSKAFDLLLVLVQSSGRDLTKDEILEKVWPGQILEESNLTVNISAVRRALGEKASQPRYLITIPGRGYRFIANVRDEQDAANGFVIESQTISQITVEEETDEVDDEAIEALERPAVSIERKEIGALNEANVLSEAGRMPALPAVFKRPMALAALVSLLIVLVSAFVLRSVWKAKVTSPRFQQVKLRQLTNDGKVINAAISPDGKFFVFLHAEKEKTSLRLDQMNGERPIELRPSADLIYRGVEFAPDSSSVYYTIEDSGNDTLYRLPILGGVPVKLRGDFVAYFAISPDNTLVAIVKEDEATRISRLLVSNLDGTNERVLVSLPANRGLFGRNLSWSPDGSMIALGISKDESGSQGAIYLLPSKGGELRQLTNVHWRDIERTAWLKDGSGILMIGASQDAQESRQVWLVDYPSGDFRRLTNDLNSYDVGLSVTSDANNVLLVQHQQISNIWVAPAEDFSRAKQITFGAFNRGDGLLGVDWAANGKIIYTAMVANSSTIWTMDADGANAKELTPPGASDTTPSVAVDGRFIIFESSRSRASEVWRMDLDGANPKQLTSCGKNSQPNVSPDGRWIVYRSECEPTGALWRVSIEGGEPKRLTEHEVFWPWISPDSKWVACEYSANAGKVQLAIIPIDGGPPAKMFDIPPLANFRYGIRWTPDGQAVTYRDWGKGLWRQPIEGGPPQQIRGLPEEKIYSYAWSRDGKLFAFTRGVEIRDVVLIRNAD